MFELTDEILREIEELDNKNHYNWKWLSYNVKLTEEFALKYRTRLDWSLMVFVQNFPIEFWIRMRNRTNSTSLYNLGYNPNISFADIKEMIQIPKPPGCHFITEVASTFIKISKLSEDQIEEIIDSIKCHDSNEGRNILRSISESQVFSINFFIKHKDVLRVKTILSRRLFKMTKHTKTMFLMYGIL